MELYTPLDDDRVIVEGRLRWIDDERVIRDDPVVWALEFRDEAGKTLCIENAETLHGRYLAHCALHGIEPLDIASR